MKERIPPAYRVLKPIGPYSKGAIIRPTGIYRDALLERKVIELVDAVAEAPATEHIPRPRDEALAEGETTAHLPRRKRV
jgi:hypothetical protein